MPVPFLILKYNFMCWNETNMLDDGANLVQPKYQN